MLGIKLIRSSCFILCRSDSPKKLNDLSLQKEMNAAEQPIFTDNPRISLNPTYISCDVTQAT